MTIFGTSIWAIIVVTLLQILLGYFWYSQAGFGSRWMKALGWNEKKMMAQAKTPAGQAMMKRTMSFMVLGAIVTSIVLGAIIDWTNAYTALAGAVVGFALWIGFVVTTNSHVVIFEQRPSTAYWIGMAYYGVCFVVGGVIFAVWP